MYQSIDRHILKKIILHKIFVIYKNIISYLNFQVALINVVHIKDAVCTLPTSILAQYLKQANGQLSCLKVCIIDCIQIVYLHFFSNYI